MFAIPGVTQMCLLFLASVAIEATCGSWGATFLVENKGLQPELAARTIMFYYIGMALGRFVSGLAANKLHSWKIIHISEGVLAVALLILLFCSAGTSNRSLVSNSIMLASVNLRRIFRSSML